MNRRHFTRSETVALSVLLAALLLVIGLTSWRRDTGKGLAAVASADSVCRVRTDSLDRLADSLRQAAREKSAARSDSLRTRRRKKAAMPKNPVRPHRRDYLDEPLSPAEAR